MTRRPPSAPRRNLSEQLPDASATGSGKKTSAEDARTAFAAHVQIIEGLRVEHAKIVETLRAESAQAVSRHTLEAQRSAALDRQVRQLQSELYRANQRAETAEHDLTEHAAQLAALREDLVRRDLEIAALRHRRSWPIGASLRALKRKIKKSLSRTPKNPLFDADWYLEKYPDVAVLGLDPYAHYLMFGAHEGRNPNPLFDTNWYLERYPDVKNEGLNPLMHYYNHGAREGRDPHPLFSTSWYLLGHPALVEQGVNALEHYLNSAKVGTTQCQP